MAAIFHPAAEGELLSTIDYYDDQRPGLGEALDSDFWALVDRVMGQPEMYAACRWHSAVREGVLRRFPYIVPYQVRGNDVRIYAIAHTARRPGYWRKRLKDQF